MANPMPQMPNKPSSNEMKNEPIGHTIDTLNHSAVTAVLTPFEAINGSFTGLAEALSVLNIF